VMGKTARSGIASSFLPGTAQSMAMNEPGKGRHRIDRALLRRRFCFNPALIIPMWQARHAP
jgi:hypothetical protein